MFCSMFIIGIITFIYFKLKKFFSIPPVPFVQERWWGPGQAREEPPKVEPFKVEISDEILQDLKRRLDSTLPFQPPIEGAKQGYGMNTNLLGEIVEFWKNGYDWREREAFLNKFPQFKMNVQGLNIHFIHVKPEAKEGVEVRPLLLLHGWPGSVREFYEIIPLLTQPRDGLVFEVVAPSLPGFGFSDGTSKPGLAPVHMAIIFKNLMKNLGIHKFYVQGGDWGSLLVQDITVLFPDNVLGMHTNMAGFASTPMGIIKMFLGRLAPRFFATDGEKGHLEIFDFKKQQEAWNKENAYFQLQSTKPDTVGVALRDSPAGLAAYILEKFTSWTNPEYRNRDDGGLKLRFDYTKLLDNVMIYWVTRTATTSMRIYCEFLREEPAFQLAKIPIRDVPCGVSRFWNEIFVGAECVLREKFLRLVFVSEHDGGHFAAFEVPDVLAGDIFAFVRAAERSRRELS